MGVCATAGSPTDKTGFTHANGISKISLVLTRTNQLTKRTYVLKYGQIGNTVLKILDKVKSMSNSKS